MLAVLSLAGGQLAAAGPAPQRVLVLPAEPADADGAAAFTGRIVLALHRTPGVTPVTLGDLDALARAQRLGDLLGCTETTCIAELAGATGIDRVLSTRLVRTEHGASCFLALHDVARAETMRRHELHDLPGLDASAAQAVAAWVAGAAPPVRPAILFVELGGSAATGQAAVLAAAVESALTAIDHVSTISERAGATHVVEIEVTTLEVVRRRHHVHRYLDGTLVATLRIRERGGSNVFTRQLRTTHSARARYSTPERVAAELCQDAARRWSAAVRANAPLQMRRQP